MKSSITRTQLYVDRETHQLTANLEVIRQEDDTPEYYKITDPDQLLSILEVDFWEHLEHTPCRLGYGIIGHHSKNQWMFVTNGDRYK